MNPVSLYVDWARKYPQKARSLEHMTNALCFMHRQLRDVVASETWMTVARLHPFLNQVIIQSGSLHSASPLNGYGVKANAGVEEEALVSTHSVLTFTAEMAVKGMRLVETLMELLCRSYYGHPVTWDVLVLWQALKSSLQLIARRKLFLLPCMWESTQQLIRRTFGFRAATPSQQPAPAPDAVEAVEFGSPQSTYPSAIAAQPSVIPLVVPRVASSKLAEHHHASLAPAADSTDMKAAERFPMSWYDVLGMVLDFYALLRPLLVVLAGRHMFYQAHPLAPSSAGKPSGFLSHLHWLFPSRGDDNVSEGSKGVDPLRPAKPKYPKWFSKKSASAPPAAVAEEEDYMECIRRVISLPRKHWHSYSWKPWWCFLVIDLVVLLLAKFICKRRVPVVYIADADLAAVPPAVPSESDAEEEPPQEEEAETQTEGDGDEGARTPTSQRRPAQRRAAVARGTATTSHGMEPSRDQQRLLECWSRLWSVPLTDPFFGIGLRRWFFDNIMVKVLNRIPLLGMIANYQLGYYFEMRHYSFLYSISEKG